MRRPIDVLSVKTFMSFGSVEWCLGVIVALHCSSQIRELGNTYHFEAPFVCECSAIVSSRHGALFVVIHKLA